MSGPITWQNVMGPSLADASRPLEAAQRTFSGIFDNLGGLMRDAEVRQETGRNILKDQHADVIRDLFANAKTPEQVAAANAQATALKAQYGEMLRPGDVRGLDEKRLVDVRNNTRQGMEFDNFLKDERSKPFMEAYRAAAVKGDKIGMANAEASYTQAGGPKLSELIAYGDQRARLGLERAEQDKQWVRNQGTYDDGLLTSKANRTHMANQDNIGFMNANTNKAELGLRQTEMEARLADRAAERVLKINEALGKVREDSLHTVEGMEKASKFIRENYEDGEIRANLLTELGKIAASPSKVPVTVGAALQAVSATEDKRWAISKFFGRDAYQGETMADDVQKAMENPGYTDGLKKTEAREGVLLQQLREATSKANAVPGGSRSKSTSTKASTTTFDAAAAEAAEAEYARTKAATPAPAQAGSYGPNGFVADPRRSPEALAREDRMRQAFNRTVGGGADRQRFVDRQTQRTEEASSQFATRLAELRAAPNRKEAQARAEWFDEMGEAGVLSRAQLVELRKARKDFGM